MFGEVGVDMFVEEYVVNVVRWVKRLYEGRKGENDLSFMYDCMLLFFLL